MILRKFQEFHTQIHERKIIFCSKKFLSFAARIPKRKKTTQQFLHLQEIYVVFVCFPSLNNQKICLVAVPSAHSSSTRFLQGWDQAWASNFWVMINQPTETAAAPPMIFALTTSLGAAAL